MSLYLVPGASLFLCVCDVSTGSKERRLQIQIPVTQSAGTYLLLCVYLVDPMMRSRCQREYKLEIPWWQYVILAFADVQGNFLVVCAYKYTSISSVMLLDCFTIPVVMLLSTVFLRAQYTVSHFLAVLCCLLGISMLVFSDVSRHDDLKASWNVTALYGDFLCLVGSAIYACSNVGQEYLVKKENRRIFLATGDAAVFNLSLLTSDFFAVVAAKFLFSEELTNLYYVGFAFIIAGVYLYNRSAPPTIKAGYTDVQDGSINHLLAS
ncbi:hypothetical protein PsorP6_016622 [Peronosclerospora sorghi]|uniref:Uncharacterized protein n=1 Tax=Peronosclerospora sorghi TaxID=230839 RepID=A0ACC0VRM4_9STRA|nr:hypothetical protein PsorP6_016622 [Peronosclerospora sorghi]